MKDEPGTIQAVASFLVGVALLIAACSRPSSTAGSSTLKPIDQAALQIEALVTGRVFDAAYQRRWLDSLQAKDPSMPDGQQYGYGMERLRWGPNAVYFHGGETPGYNAHMGYDPNSQVTFVTWTNLPISVEGKWTSMALVLKIWDQIYVVSPLTAFPSPTATP